MIINNTKRDALIKRYKNLKYWSNDLIGPDIIKADHHSCTDHFNISLKIKNNHIIEGYYNGEGCVISTVSIDFIIENCIGLDLKEAINNLKHYEKMINGEVYKDNNIKKLLLFDNISKYPNRIICASLGSTNILNYLKKI